MERISETESSTSLMNDWKFGGDLIFEEPDNLSNNDSQEEQRYVFRSSSQTKYLL